MVVCRLMFIPLHDQQGKTFKTKLILFSDNICDDSRDLIKFQGHAKKTNLEILVN